MTWNWQLENWPHFIYNSSVIAQTEKEFLLNSGLSLGLYEALSDDEKSSFRIQIMEYEAAETSAIEGINIDHDSFHSSILSNFGLKADIRRPRPYEKGLSEMMYDLYINYNKPLSHETLFYWHKLLMHGRQDINDIGCYRTDETPMQIISGPIHKPKIHYEAVPTARVHIEMDYFIATYNQLQVHNPLLHSAILHLLFESIHPFEDGNGRIGRSLVEKCLAQHLGFPCHISLSKVISSNKKLYYEQLGKASKTLHIDDWIKYFADIILQAQKYSHELIKHIIKKKQFWVQYGDLLNERQSKVIGKMFDAGPEGFTGGLSAAKYISITNTARATATRDLQDLVDKKILRKEGELKSTKYYLYSHQKIS